MKKRLLSLFLCLVMTLSLCSVTALAAEERDFTLEEGLAADLKALGLYNGVSATDFDLDGTLDRVGTVVMLVRLLGEEQTAMQAALPHPFTDIPVWADAHIGYAVEHGLANGGGTNQFGTSRAEAYTYLTLVLRALGYSDAPGGDFTWNDPFPLALEVGILPEQVDTVNFLRADVVLISYAALGAQLKDSQQTLAEKLIDSGVFSRARFESCYDPNALSSAELTAQEIAARCSSAVGLVETWSFNGEARGQGSAFFITSDGLAVTNFHVVENTQDIVLTMPDGTVYDAVTIIDYDYANDVALLKVDAANLPYLIAGDSANVKQGQTIYTIGNPLGLTDTMSTGIVSAPSRDVDGVSYIQISAPIAQGSSGGALLDQYGRVIGITSAGFDSAADLNLAIPMDAVRALEVDSTEDLVLFGDDLYPGFETVPDFGICSGVELTSSYNNLLGQTYEYNVWDFYELHGRDSADCYADTLYYYHENLLLYGFTPAEGTTLFNGAYINETAGEVVYLSIDLDKGILQVAPMYDPPAYEAHPELPDFGWYTGLSQVDEPLDDSESTLYSYYWPELYSAEELEHALAAYFDLLSIMGGYEYLGFFEEGGYAFTINEKFVFITPYESYLFVTAFY